MVGTFQYCPLPAERQKQKGVLMEREKRINYLRCLIGKLQQSDNANSAVYQTAVMQLSDLYEEAANV